MDSGKGRKRDNSPVVVEKSDVEEEEEDEEETAMTSDLRRGPWTVEEDFTLINYISLHGEGRWNSLARSAGLKRTGKSCRLRWLNYLRPDVRRGNITLEEQLLILELHSRWGNRWSKIAQHLPGRTDNEIKNYWRTRVQKHAKQLKCDVNSKQFKDTMRYLWMPRLIERIQAASGSTPTTSSLTTAPVATYPLHPSSMDNVYSGQQVVPPQANCISEDYKNVQITPSCTPENSSHTAVSPASDLTDCYYYPANQWLGQDGFQPYDRLGFSSEPLISPCGQFSQGFDFQPNEPSNSWVNGGDTSDNLWNVEDIWVLQDQFSSNM